ncbi:esterase-like activity of phytase family protein [Streptacidiphilus sp. N1-10]|uniref:Esterase-like activity of phytase family protein n=1 Tax=Streptacidiphilus jeojiensis TaxID=3229225 RepID=A0ABV6XME8_9ACTN
MPPSKTPHPTRSSRRVRAAAVAALMLASPLAIPAASARAEAPTGGHLPSPSLACGADAWAEGYSDALNKLVVDGDTVGGLSALSYDARRHAYGAVVDHSTGELAKIWFFADPASPKVVGSLVLRKPDGTPYDETDFDGEGLAVLPNGDYLVSSETEPSVREFDRQGVQQSELAVPARFLVAPAGQATSNATLEGLSVSPDGSTVYAAMEGVLSGDVSSTGAATDRRILVYRANHRHGYDLVKEIGYQVDPGNRISEVAAYGQHGLLVLEAAFTAGFGNTIKVYAAPNVQRSADVTAVTDLGNAGSGELTKKTLIADVSQCPSLGATAPEPQPNPILDNYEGMTLAPGSPCSGLSELLLISDDNFSAAQNTRLLRLTVRLPS